MKINRGLEYQMDFQCRLLQWVQRQTHKDKSKEKKMNKNKNRNKNRNRNCVHVNGE